MDQPESVVVLARFPVPTQAEGIRSQSRAASVRRTAVEPDLVVYAVGRRRVLLVMVAVFSPSRSGTTRWPTHRVAADPLPAWHPIAPCTGGQRRPGWSPKVAASRPHRPVVWVLAAWRGTRRQYNRGLNQTRSSRLASQLGHHSNQKIATQGAGTGKPGCGQGCLFRRRGAVNVARLLPSIRCQVRYAAASVANRSITLDSPVRRCPRLPSRCSRQPLLCANTASTTYPETQTP